MDFSKLEIKGNYIQGKFHIPKKTVSEFPVISPANDKDHLGMIPYSYEEVEDAVQASREAYLSWRLRSISERINFLMKYKEALKKREELLSEIISREMGKPLWESKTEVSAMIGKVDLSCGEMLKQVTDEEFPNIMPGTLGACRYKPLGVLVVLGPFNFPGHLPNGHIVPALVSGNTVIFKPSEKTPLTGQLIAECFHEAGLPPGVFQLVQGEREVGRRLCVHEGVAGVLFTGSYEVGLKIKQDTLHQHWKLLALEMGGKNASIVFDDVDLDFAVHEALTGSYITTGQRCSCTSRIFVHKKIIDEFVKKFHQKAKAFEIDHPFKNPFMGPLIDRASVDRFMKFSGIAEREGAEVIMRGKPLEKEFVGNYVSPSLFRMKEMSLEEMKKSVYIQTELFAPSVSINPFEEVDEVIEKSNLSQYGLVVSVLTKDRKKYEYCYPRLEAGLINWNKTTVGASSKLPFGGVKKSGNHFPAGSFSPRYCTVPVATLENSEQSLPKIAPGLNW